MVAVSSSMIKDVTYDPDTSDMFVTFSNNRKWKYSDVPEDTYDSFIRSGSVGNFFHSQIKNAFDGESV